MRNRIGVITWIPDPNYARIASDPGEEDLKKAKLLAQGLSAEEAVSWATSPEPPQIHLSRLEAGLPATLSQLSSRDFEVVGLITQ